jgi:7,8-dihydropterin-6-yl-methyl-4-(beta-D-ribofuranosyl)aminobenzene 5'-phosphate synthase
VNTADLRALEPLPDLDALEVLVVVDNETDTLSSVNPGIPQAPELAALARRTPATQAHGHDCKQVFDQLCFACHGFSVLLTAERGGERHSVLFDVGPEPEIWLGNARRLGVNLAAIEHIFLSHWHFDHSGCLPQVTAAVAEARRAAGLPAPVVDVSPDRPDQRGILMPSGTLLLLPEEPTFGAIEAAGGELVRHAEGHAFGGGCFFGSGAIARTTSYELGLVGHHSIRAGVCEPDPLILDERYVAARVRGRGVSLFSACSHAGIVNACRDCKRRFPGLELDLVLGGFHLAGAAMEPRIEPTLADLRDEIRPRLLGPGHCTGWRAKARLAAAFAPEHYAPSVVGTRYRLVPTA